MRALEILLERRWILKSREKELYYQIKDELGTVKKFLMEKLGYQVIVNPYLVKVEKMPATPENWMGIQEFTRKIEYVFFCMILMFLEEKEAEEQFVLSELTEYIQGQYREEQIDWTVYQYRRHLIKVIKYCVNCGILNLNDGSEENFARDDTSEVLYENTGVSRYFMKNFTQDIMGYTTPEDQAEKESLSDSDTVKLKQREVEIKSQLEGLKKNITGKQRQEEEKKETKADHILQPDFRTWETLLVRGMGKTVYEEACRYLQELADAEALNAESLQKFYNDFYRIICLTEEKTDTSWEDIFPEEQQRQTALHAYETLQNMQVFLKIVTSYFAEEEEDAGRAGSQVEAIKEYIYHHLDSDIRREDIAVQVFMNPNYVSRLFKKVEGISLKEFIVREKMKMARALLISSQLPVSIVALKVGYSNFSHFSQVYRKTFGVSPTDERKKQEE